MTEVDTKEVCTDGVAQMEQKKQQVWKIMKRLLEGPPHYYHFEEQTPSEAEPLCLAKDLGWTEMDVAAFWIRFEDLFVLPEPRPSSGEDGGSKRKPPQFAFEVPWEEQLYTLTSLWLAWNYLAQQLTDELLTMAVVQNRRLFGPPSAWQRRVVERNAMPRVDPFGMGAALAKFNRRLMWAVPETEATVLLFPGQGVQKVGMGLLAASVSEKARDLFRAASEVLGYDLYHVCTEGPQERLDQTDVCQAAVFVCSLATVEVIREQAPELLERCVATAGLSLGEYSAYVFAEALSFEDGLRLVAARGRAMHAAAASLVPSGMTALLGDSPSKISDVLRLINRDLDQLAHHVSSSSASSSSSSSSPSSRLHQLSIANYLTDTSVTVAGGLDSLAFLESRAEAMGLKKAMRLPVAGAFHSPFMQPAVASLQLALARAKFSAPRFPALPHL